MRTAGGTGLGQSGNQPLSLLSAQIEFVNIYEHTYYIYTLLLFLVAFLFLADGGLYMMYDLVSVPIGPSHFGLLWFWDFF